MRTLPRLACFGLGSVAASASSSNPIVQLAYFVILNRLITALVLTENEGSDFVVAASLLARNVEPCEVGVEAGDRGGAWACAHDPVFSDIDITLLSAVGVQATRAAHCRGCDTRGDSSGGRTVFFMPHCPWTLNAAVLCRQAWRCSVSDTEPTAPLWATCIIGNSFDSYTPMMTSQSSPQLLLPFSRGLARGSLELAAAGVETRPAFAIDAIAAVMSMCTRGRASGEEGCTCTWSLDETHFDDALAGRRGDASFAQALSSTSLHHFYLRPAEMIFD